VYKTLQRKANDRPNPDTFVEETYIDPSTKGVNPNVDCEKNDDNNSTSSFKSTKTVVEDN